MIRALVYSRDRAAQLDLLLTSVEQNAPWIDPLVLFTCQESHESSYDLVRDEHPVFFQRERDFEAQTREFLSYANPVFMWLVDDGVFFQMTGEPKLFPYSHRRPGSHRWREHPDQSEPGYPLAVCDTAYKTASILALLNFHFTDPNELERGLHARREHFQPTVVYGGVQSFCTVEHNAVSPSSVNPTMGGDVDELRDRFLAGQRISMRTFSEPASGTHVQIPYVWDDP